MDLIYNIGGALIAALLFVSCSEENLRNIVCWGDSLTSPHVSNSIKGQAKKLILDDSSYPGQLQKLLGDKFNVINCGVGGETSLTIMARQGSAPMRLAHSVIIYDDNHKEFDNFLGNATIPAFKADWCFGSDSDPFRVVAPLLQCHYEEYSQAYVNPCVIKGREFMIKSETNF